MNKFGTQIIKSRRLDEQEFYRKLACTVDFSALDTEEDTLKFNIRLVSQKRTTQVLEIVQGSQVISTIELQPAECKDISGYILLSKGKELEIKGKASLFAIASFKYDYACTLEPKGGQYFWKEPLPKKIPMNSQSLKVWNISDEFFPKNIPQFRDSLLLLVHKWCFGKNL
jgi:hypothetical protein